MARLRALSLAAAVILVLLCQSEAVCLAPSSSTTTAGNATVSGGNGTANAADNATASGGKAASIKPASTSKPLRKMYRFPFVLGEDWGKRSDPSMSDIIVFESSSVLPDKQLFQFETQEAYKNRNYKRARLLTQFSNYGELYRYDVPYTHEDHLYFGPNEWMCLFMRFKLKIPLAGYNP